MHKVQVVLAKLSGWNSSRELHSESHRLAKFAISLSAYSDSMRKSLSIMWSNNAAYVIHTYASVNIGIHIASYKRGKVCQRIAQHSDAYVSCTISSPVSQEWPSHIVHAAIVPMASAPDLCMASAKVSSPSKLHPPHKARALLSECSSNLGKETLSFRIFHDHESYICERRLVEQDGTSFTVVLPFDNPAKAREFLAADPYYDRLRDKVGRMLIRLNGASRGQRSS